MQIILRLASPYHLSPSSNFQRSPLSKKCWSWDARLVKDDARFSTLKLLLKHVYFDWWLKLQVWGRSDSLQSPQLLLTHLHSFLANELWPQLHKWKMRRFPQHLKPPDGLPHTTHDPQSRRAVPRFPSWNRLQSTHTWKDSHDFIPLANPAGG